MEKNKKDREDEMKYQTENNKRLKIEKKKQEYHQNQKQLIEKFREKKRETESLLRISFDKNNKGNLNITSPEYQFNDSYMKKRVQKAPKSMREEQPSMLYV